MTDIRTFEELRGEAGLTRLALALQVGVTEVTVYRWERGGIAPALRHLRPLAQVLGVDLETIVAAWEASAIAI